MAMQLDAGLLVRPSTGEVIDTETMSLEALIALAADLQDEVRAAREAASRVQQALIRRMEADRATVAEAGDLTARIRYESKPDVNTLLHIREHITPEEFDRAFKAEYRPMKRTLNELAKRGGILRDIIEAGYRQVPKLTIERGGAENG